MLNQLRTVCQVSGDTSVLRTRSRELQSLRHTSRPLLCCLCGLFQRFPPFRHWRIPHTKLLLELFNILRPPLLPVHRDQAFRRATASESPGNVFLEQTCAFGRREPDDGQSGKRGHRKSKIGEFEELESNLVFDRDGKGTQRVVEVVTFAVALHHVGEFRVVDVVYLRQ